MPRRKKRPKPPVGTICRRMYKGKPYTMEVIREGEKIKYQVNDTAYPSPSAAAKSITQTEINGWRFWGLDS